MKLLEHFLEYVKIYTQSDEESGMHPSAEREFDLCRVLVRDLDALGLTNVHCDEHGYVYGFLPATEGYENAPKVGFIAHVDTAPDFTGKDVKPIIHENYNGEDLELIGRTLKVSDFPHLAGLKGKTLITTDGTTLLGADDKAGVCEIIGMLETIIEENIPHGYIAVGFTPDEEIGEGADLFDVEKFGCDFAYTVDGAEPGEVVYQNFNAAGATFKVRGFNVHPGSAKGLMINASLVAMEINSMLPSADIPALTENYEGFFHLTSMVGNTESAELNYIVRDHDFRMYDSRLMTLRHIEKTINEKYGEGTVALNCREQYRNMEEIVMASPKAVEIANRAIEALGITPIHPPIRGGTDGARLSYMGLPCPNLGTGGYAFHGPCEHITLEGMEDSVKILVSIVKECAK